MKVPGLHPDQSPYIEYLGLRNWKTPFSTIIYMKLTLINIFPHYVLKAHEHAEDGGTTSQLHLRTCECTLNSAYR